MFESLQRTQQFSEGWIPISIGSQRLGGGCYSLQFAPSLFV